MMANDEKKRLFSNFVSLVIVQGLNFLLPLLVLPYLLYTLGVEIFGILAMATAFISYFLILSDYGFNITATREISVYRDNPQKLNEIFSAVLTIKILLMLLGFLILSVALSLFEALNHYASIYFLTFGMVAGQVLFPIWFFQGMEKMGYIAILNIIAKLFFLIALFIFVQEKEDAYLVPLLNSLGFILVGLGSLIYLYRHFAVRFVWQPYSVLERYFSMGWHIFLSRMAVVLYTSSNIFLLGLFTTPLIVGYFAIADKVISAIVSLGDVLNQVFFPYLSKKWEENQEAYYELFYRLIKAVAVGMFFISFLVATFASTIVIVLSGEEIEITSELLQILSFSIALFPLGGLFSNSFVTQQESQYVTKSTIWTLLVNLILVLMLVPIYGAYGLAMAVVLVQVFHFIVNFYYFNFLKKRESICVV